MEYNKRTFTIRTDDRKRFKDSDKPVNPTMSCSDTARPSRTGSWSPLSARSESPSPSLRARKEPTHSIVEALETVDNCDLEIASDQVLPENPMLTDIFNEVWKETGLVQKEKESNSGGSIKSTPVFSSSQTAKLKSIFDGVVGQDFGNLSFSENVHGKNVENVEAINKFDYFFVHCLECNCSVTSVKEIFDETIHKCMKAGINFMFCERCELLLNSVKSVKEHQGSHDSQILFLHAKKENENDTVFAPKPDNTE